MYNRRIICDIDDTISFTTSRDWKNAKPNDTLIKKLNDLYDAGWEIVYCTARGTLSCENREKAKEKYETGILDWFRANNVKYTRLSFMKELGMYYIDDKAVTPENFIDLDIEIIKSRSGNCIERHGNKIYKTAENSISAANWYNQAKNIIPVPKVNSLVGQTICLDYIQKDAEPKIEIIDDYIEKFKKVKSYVPFETYLAKIRDRLEKHTYKYNVLDIIMKHISFFDKNRSFCHGNMCFENMIMNSGTLYLIDPIYEVNMYSSWVLDAYKLAKHNAYFKEKYKHLRSAFKVLELCELIENEPTSEKVNAICDELKHLAS